MKTVITNILTIFSLFIMLSVFSPTYGQWQINIIDDDNIGFGVSVNVADMNFDNKSDLIVTHGDLGSGQIILYQNDFPHWNKNIIDNVMVPFASPADINGDDTIDVVACLYKDRKMVWYENSPSRGWIQHIIAENTNWNDYVVVVDLNNDGKLDVVSAVTASEYNHIGDIVWYENNLSNPFSPWIEHIIESDVSGCGYINVSDFDGDGFYDIVATKDKENEVVLYRNDNNGITWTKYLVDENLTHAWIVNNGDLNNDGKMDIVATAGGPYYNVGDVVWYENDYPNWIKHIIDTDLPGANFAEVSDVDSDGRLDLIAGGFTADDVVWYKNNHPTWTKDTIDADLNGPRMIALEDLDGDEINDVIVAAVGQIVWYKNPYEPPLVNDDWTQKANIPTARTSAASCELNGKIYVIGGEQDLNSSLNAMEVYDPVTDTWDTTKAPMPTPRTEMCVAAVNGKIYAIGGAPFHYGKPVGMVAEYDPLTDTWDTTKAAMPTPREVSSWGVFNNKIYIAGGNSSSTYTLSKKMEIYDPATDTWTTGADMLASRYAAKGVFLNDTLYVIGGVTNSPFHGQSEVQKYDPITDSWTWGTSLLTGRIGHTANTLNGYIYVLGGDRNDPITIMWNVERYDPHARTWTVIDTIPSVMCNHTASVYKDEIYAFSGSPTGVYPASLTDAVYSYKPPIPTVVELHNNIITDDFVLHQNYPNPFNPVTTIKYSIPLDVKRKTKDGKTFIRLNVYDILGREIAQLVNERQKPGHYEVEWDAHNQPSGVYFYQLHTGDFVETKKMILLK